MMSHDIYGIFLLSGIIHLCKTNGFEFIAAKPMLFDAFYVSYLSEQHQGNKFAFLKGLCIGLWSNKSTISPKNTLQSFMSLKRTPKFLGCLLDDSGINKSQQTKAFH